jgi:uncharacterized integral membrane protein
MDSSTPEKDKRAQERQIALGILAVLAVVFCAVNFDEVQVNWIIGSWSTPLIVVIVVSALIGAGADRLVLRRSRKADELSGGRR